MGNYQNNEENISKVKSYRNDTIDININKKRNNSYTIEKQQNFNLKNIYSFNEQIYDFQKNNYLNKFSIYNDDIILFEMKQKYIKEKEVSFKEEIKTELKNEFLLNISESIQKINKEINNMKKNFIEEKNYNKTELKNLSTKINNKNDEIKLVIDNYKKSSDSLIEQLNFKLKEFQSNIELFKRKLKEKNKSYFNIIKDAIGNFKTKIRKKSGNEEKNKEELFKNIDIYLKKNKSKLNDNLNKTNSNHDMKMIRFDEENKDIDIEKIQKELDKLYIEINNFKKDENISSKIIENKNKSYEKIKENLKKCILSKRKKNQNDIIRLFSKKGYGKTGLRNIGNNCYMNSILQLLKNIPKFTRNFINLNKNNDSFLESMKELLLKICSSENSYFSPDKFKEFLGKENSKFMGNEQYDSTIFYVSLLNIIHKKLNIAKREDYIKYDKSPINLIDKFYKWKEFFLSRNKSFIIDFFYIFFVNQISCTSCKNVTHTFQSSNFFDFPIVSKTKNIESLEECFERYQEINDVTNKENFNCTNCGKYTLNHQFIILELPPVLMINLKRVGENTAYFNDIEIPLELEVDKIIKNTNNHSIYELRGFIKHSGTEKGGHNFAFCKNMFDEKWYEYNDSSCISLDNTPSLEKIFFLCYIKIGCDINSCDYLKEITDYLNEYI